jgi:NADH oxidase (H2O2-forming)
MRDTTEATGTKAGTENIVIIGLGVGGLYASKSASTTNRKAMVTIIERRDFDMFSPCGLPFAIEGIVPDFESLKHEVPTARNVQKLLGHEVQSIDSGTKTLIVKDLRTCEEKSLPYDSLILATGAEPVNLPIPGAKDFMGRGFHYVTNPTDSEELRDAALSSKKKSACVVGGGAIGLEVAIALKALGLDVHVTKRSPPPFPRNLDPDMGGPITEHLEEMGLHVHFGKGIDSINGKDWIESVTIAGEEIPCDIVVMAVGMRSRIGLAESCGVEICPQGIVTGSRMQTNIPGIYAIGDCVESFCRIDEARANMLLATSAYRMGMIAGTNAAGGEAHYKGVLNTFVSKVGEIEVAATGYNLQAAIDAGFQNAKGVKVKGVIKPHWMPGATPIALKLILDKDTGKILGGQAVGKEGAAWRINIISLAITAGLDIFDLANAEFAYSPPVSEVYDVLSQIAEIGIKRLKLTKKVE